MFSILQRLIAEFSPKVANTQRKLPNNDSLGVQTFQGNAKCIFAKSEGASIFGFVFFCQEILVNWKKCLRTSIFNNSEKNRKNTLKHSRIEMWWYFTYATWWYNYLEVKSFRVLFWLPVCAFKHAIPAALQILGLISSSMQIPLMHLHKSF